MAKNPAKTVTVHKDTTGKKSHRGVHSKKKSSSSKTSKNYKKPYVGQGH